MNFQQLSTRLRGESEAAKNEVQELMHTMLLSYTCKVFTDYKPSAQHMKLTMHFRPLDSNVLITPLECFFPEYMKGVKFENVEILNTEGGSFPSMLKITTQNSSFWIHIQTSFGGINYRVVNETGTDGIDRVSIETRTGCTHDQDGTPVFLMLVHIDPYTCTLCHTCRKGMSKCKGCWENLGINVRYCDKYCQRTHFKLQHKHVCGKGV
jgi:hypothetical protein